MVFFRFREALAEFLTDVLLAKHPFLPENVSTCHKSSVMHLRLSMHIRKFCVSLSSMWSEGFELERHFN